MQAHESLIFGSREGASQDVFSHMAQDVIQRSADGRVVFARGHGLLRDEGAVEEEQRLGGHRTCFANAHRVVDIAEVEDLKNLVPLIARGRPPVPLRAFSNSIPAPQTGAQDHQAIRDE